MQMKTCFWTAEEETVQRYPQSQIKETLVWLIFTLRVLWDGSSQF